MNIPVCKSVLRYGVTFLSRYCREKNSIKPFPVLFTKSLPQTVCENNKQFMGILLLTQIHVGHLEDAIYWNERPFSLQIVPQSQEHFQELVSRSNDLQADKIY